MTRDEYVRKMHSRLDQWNNDIDSLLARADKIEESARTEYATRVEDLRQRRDQAKEQLKQMQEASESAWQDLKGGMEMAWDAIGQAVDSARSRYNK